MNVSQVNENDWQYISPQLVYQNTVAIRTLAGTFAIVCWDILDNLNNDYRLLFKYRVGLPTVAYFISRLGALGYILGSLLLATAPIADCQALQEVLAWMYVMCIAATSLLFFFRVRAIFSRSKYVVWTFSFMWFAVLGAAITVTQAGFATRIGSTRYCTTKAMKPFVVVCVIGPLVYDTLVLLAVTVGLAMNTHLEPTLKQGIRTAMYGDYLPAFSRAMLRDNQMYYLATVGLNLLTVVVFYIRSLPLEYRIVLGAPSTMVTNVMACRVFRNTKIGNKLWVDPTLNIPSILLQAPDANSSATRTLGSNQSHGSRGAIKAEK